MYTCSDLYYVYGKSQLWLQTQWPSSIAGCNIVSLFAKWNNSMIWDISPLITQGLQLASMSAPFTDGYDVVLFITKYLQSIDEHCECKLALVHHCNVKSMFDEHCRGPQTIIIVHCQVSEHLLNIVYLHTFTTAMPAILSVTIWMRGRGVQVKDEWGIMWECCVAR